MRIAVFSETTRHDGVAVVLGRLVRSLCGMGHEVLVATPQGSLSNGAPLPNGCTFVAVPSLPLPGNRDVRIATPVSPRVARAVREFRPDVIHIVTAYSVGLIGLQMARRLRIPAVASFHASLPDILPYYGFGWGAGIMWGYLRWFHKNVAITFCPSASTAQRLRSRGFENVRVWSHGVETSRFCPANRSEQIRKSHGPPDALHVLYVGRFAPEKNLPVLFDAYRRVTAARPQASHLVLVGDGVYSARTVKRAPAHTTATGYLHGEDLVGAYASADVFVLPSRVETQGNVVLEAMASGLPVIAVREGGVQENVRDGVNGLLCEPGDPQSLADGIVRLLDDSALRKKLAANAVAWASERSWEASLAPLLAGYEEAAAGG